MQALLKMHIMHNRILQILTLLQKIYLKRVLKNFRLEEIKVVATLIKLRVYLIKTAETASSQLIKQYQSVIESLMYTMTQTYLNIAYAVSTLSQFAHNSNKMRWKVLKWVIHYVCRTLDINIEYKLICEWLKLLGFLNSDWGEDLNSRKSTSEYIFQLINGSVSWSLKCQKTVTLFFCKAEYMILIEITKKAVWMQRLLKELKLKNLTWWWSVWTIRKSYHWLRTQNLHSSSLHKRSQINRPYLTQLHLYKQHGSQQTY